MLQQKNLQKQNIFLGSNSSFVEQHQPTKSVYNTKLRKQRGSNPSIFISKTFEILQNEEYKSIIKWNYEGTAFIIQDIEKFEQEVLPIYFRHKNYSSFVRQLNMYDFHKIRNQANRNIFEHKQFRRLCRESLKNIRRKGCTSGKKTIIDEPIVQNDENQDPEVILSEKAVGNIGQSKATVQNSQTMIQKMSSPKYHDSSYTLNFSPSNNDSPVKKKLIEEFLQALPETIRDQRHIEQIIRNLKKNTKYSCLHSKRELKSIVRKIKHLKLPRFSNPNDLDDLSIQEQIIVENAQPQSHRNLSLAIFQTQKYLPMKSISVIGSLNFLEDADLIFPH